MQPSHEPSHKSSMGNRISHAARPERIETVPELEDLLSEPTGDVIEALAAVEGNLVILGVGGKMGPTLARMAVRGIEAAGTKVRVLGVSRFSDSGLTQKLESQGVETIQCDLMDRRQVEALPDASHVVAMSGMKFGASGQPSLTWAMNTHVAAIICERYRQSRIVAFSTGNIYPFAPVHLGGSLENDPVGPVGEYAASALGRERIYEHFSRHAGIPMAILRLNYANELRYGVLVDVARKVQADEPIELAAGHVNAIWQADANAMALASFKHVASPPLVLNVAGPETLSVRRIAQQFGQLLGKPVTLSGEEAETALLSNSQLSHRLFGYPRASAGQMMLWIADWVSRGGESLHKPTHFESRDGKF